MDQKILNALKELDASNDNHWTADGQPRLDTVKLLAADPAITRDMVLQAAPGFMRSTAVGYMPPAGELGPAGGVDLAGQGDSGSPLGVGAAGAPLLESGAESGPSVLPVLTEQSEVADRVATDADEIKALEAFVEETDARAASIRREMDLLKEELSEVVATNDRAREKLDQLRPADTNQSAIAEYLQSQNRRLEERAARKSILANSGVDLRELARDLRSPLDAAMVRKTGRGGQRPKL